LGKCCTKVLTFRSENRVWNRGEEECLTMLEIIEEEQNGWEKAEAFSQIWRRWGGLLMLNYVSHVKINKYGSYKSLWCVETWTCKQIYKCMLL
jgi:hypothetical protein